MKFKISCVIPTHNRRTLALRAIKSVLDTRYSNLEIIIIDDASMPEFILPRDMVNIPQIKVIRLLEPSGGAVARNAGVCSSTGDLICFLDDDDELLPNKFDLMSIPFLTDSKIDAVVAECRIIDLKSESELDCNNPHFSRLNNTIKNKIHTNATLIKRSVFNTIEFNEKLQKFQDTQFNTDLCFLFNVVHFNTPVAKWYTNHGGGQITTRKALLFSSRNYFLLLTHFILKTRIPIYLLYEHLMRLFYLLLRLK